jgi:hypothetical protein
MPHKPIDTGIFLTWREDESQTKSAISPSNPGGDTVYEGSAIAANRRPAKGLALTTSGTHDPCGNLRSTAFRFWSSSDGWVQKKKHRV